MWAWNLIVIILKWYYFQIISIYGKALKDTEERVKELKSKQK